MRMLIYGFLLLNIPAVIVVIGALVLGKPIYILPAVMSMAFNVAPAFLGFLWWYTTIGRNPDPDKESGDHH